MLKSLTCKLLKFFHDQLFQEIIWCLGLRIYHSNLFTNTNRASGRANVPCLVKGALATEQPLEVLLRELKCPTSPSHGFFQGRLDRFIAGNLFLLLFLRWLGLCLHLTKGIRVFFENFRRSNIHFAQLAIFLLGLRLWLLGHLLFRHCLLNYRFRLFDRRGLRLSFRFLNQLILWLLLFVFLWCTLCGWGTHFWLCRFKRTLVIFLLFFTTLLYSLLSLSLVSRLLLLLLNRFLLLHVLISIVKTRLPIHLQCIKHEVTHLPARDEALNSRVESNSSKGD